MERVFWAFLVVTVIGVWPSFAVAQNTVQDTTQNTTQNETVDWAVAPEWVEETDIPPMPESRRNQVSDGVFYNLVDQHLRWEGSTRIAYSRLVSTVVARSGLEEAGAFSRSFDPAFTNLALVRVDIIRDGERLVLKDKVKPRVFQRETDLDKGIIDGRLTLHLDVPGLRVGDMLDIVTMYRGEPKIGQLNRTYARKLDWSTPEGATVLTIDWEKDRPFHLKDTTKGFSFSKTDMREITRYRWERVDGDPIYSEGNVPVSEQVWGSIIVSEHGDWAPVVDAMLEHYTKAHPVPRSFVKKVAQIKASAMPERTRAIAALRLVQENIRYVGIEIGDGGYFARSPAVVDENGFGDCKDKSVLLKAILDALDIPSAVVLVHSSKGARLVDVLPSPHVFNHMIVRVDLKDGPLWVDPTLGYQGGLVTGYAGPDYHYGLPLEHGVDALQVIEVPDGAVNRRHMTETFDFGAEAMVLTVETQAEGAYADWYREKFANESLRDYGKDLEKYYVGQYPGIAQVQELSFSDDLDHNRFTFSEKYSLPNEALNKPDLFTAFGFTPDGINGFYDPPNEVSRQYSMKLRHAYDLNHTVIVRDAPIHFNPPEKVVIANPHFEFQYFGEVREKYLKLEWRLETQRDVVAAAAYPKWKEDVGVMEDNDYWEWDLTPEEPARGLLETVLRALIGKN